MCVFDPSITTSPSAEDEAALLEARENGFDSIEDFEAALAEFAEYAERVAS